MKIWKSEFLGPKPSGPSPPPNFFLGAASEARYIYIWTYLDEKKPRFSITSMISSRGGREPSAG